MEKRQITKNILKTVDIIAYANYKKHKQLIITIDFEKCFDRIDYSAIYGTLNYFGFESQFINYIKLFFTKFSICTQNTGFCSPTLYKERSVNQGCNISPYLYLLCGEVMAHKILQNPQIQGITIGEVKLAISQFADDTVLFINYDLDKLNAIISTFNNIEVNTGLKINYDKTTIYCIGSLKDSNAQLYTSKNFAWSDGDINVLGVNITNGDPTSDALNECIDKMETTCAHWYHRQFTLIGKILIINTLCSSLFVYKMLVLPSLTKAEVKRIYNIINDFIWKGWRTKIPLKTLMNLKSMGDSN